VIVFGVLSMTTDKWGLSVLFFSFPPFSFLTFGVKKTQNKAKGA